MVQQQPCFEVLFLWQLRTVLLCAVVRMCCAILNTSCMIPTRWISEASVHSRAVAVISRKRRIGNLELARRPICSDGPTRSCLARYVLPLHSPPQPGSADREIIYSLEFFFCCFLPFFVYCSFYRKAHLAQLSWFWSKMNVSYTIFNMYKYLSRVKKNMKYGSSKCHNRKAVKLCEVAGPALNSRCTSLFFRKANLQKDFRSPNLNRKLSKPLVRTERDTAVCPTTLPNKRHHFIRSTMCRLIL